MATAPKPTAAELELLKVLWQLGPATAKAVHLQALETRPDMASATVLRQLGVFHEPEHILGRLGAVLMHPLTMTRIVSRRVLRQR